MTQFVAGQKYRVTRAGFGLNSRNTSSLYAVGDTVEVVEATPDPDGDLFIKTPEGNTWVHHTGLEPLDPKVPGQDAAVDALLRKVSDIDDQLWRCDEQATTYRDALKQTATRVTQLRVQKAELEQFINHLEGAK